METQRTRRSDRIAVKLPITVSGTDGMGRDFLEETETLVLSCHGAKIALNRKLVPDLELSIRCAASGREADVRVVGQIGEGPEGFYYGVEILDPHIDLWGIEFPPLADSERAVARVLLECVRCRGRELTYLNEFEAEVFEANKILSRACKGCRDTTLWKLSEAAAALPAPAEAAPPALAPPPVAPPGPQVRAENERKVVRVSLRMKACIRTAQFGDEIVLTENVSRGGFSFKSSKRYAKESIVEVCVPYSPEGGNIFSAARVEHAEGALGQGATSYGVAYIPVHKGWPGK